MTKAPTWKRGETLPIEISQQMFRLMTTGNPDAAPNRIGEHGGRNGEVLHPVQPAGLSPGDNGSEKLRAAVSAKDLERAERIFSAKAQKDPREAFDELLYTVQEDTHVHRTVLPYRAWELLSLVGNEHAHTLLRQSVRYCVKEQPHGEPSKVLTKVLDSHKLSGVARPVVGLPTTNGLTT